MASYRYPLIAREGRFFIIPVVLAAIATHHYVGGLPAAFAWSLAVFVLILFRDPARIIPANPRGVISPVDARVLAIGPAMDGRLMRHSLLITLSMDRLGPYSVRSPTEGKVMQQWYPAPKKSTRGKFAQWIQTDEKDDLVIEFVKTPFVQRGSCLVTIGERVGQGQRCGYIPFGTQVDIWLPQDSRPTVKVGDQVRSGVNVLAMIVHAEKAE